MHHEPSSSPRPLEDEAVQVAVLSHLVTLHPAQLSVAEIERELDDHRFTSGGEIKVAIRELVGSGLLHKSGEFVFPSRAAVRFWELRI
jgi:hypothetical protein